MFYMASTISPQRSMALLWLCVVLAVTWSAWLPPIIAKGNKFFYSDSGLEFRIKGMVYSPQPNNGDMAKVENYDWTADDHESVWQTHLAIMAELGVNTIRLYSVDPSKSHDKFMCACSKLGMYVLVGMSAPCKNCALLDKMPPTCYPDALFSRMQMVYNAFAVYDNTLGFSVANENNLLRSLVEDGTQTLQCAKALLRDVRNYASSCGETLRQVPIGLDLADVLPRNRWIQYYDCIAEDNEFTRAEWLGFNPYVECDTKTRFKYTQSTALQVLMKEYKESDYSRPIMFGEFGCNLGVNTIDGWQCQRQFNDARWMNEERDMTDRIVGGSVFEFTTEKSHLRNQSVTKGKDPGKYGVGYFSPDDCDHDTTPCTFQPYPEFENLKEAYTKTKNSTLSINDFVPALKAALRCPRLIPTELRKTPDVPLLNCSARMPKCDGFKSNNGPKDQARVVKVGDKLAPTREALAVKQVRAAVEGSIGSGSSFSAATNLAHDPTTTVMALLVLIALI
ncbi:TPA: LOW QUALITY PROTEIN: hypothetical protein N0F65_011538 [Lagenidium giganteum]|uniref:1,3-beta-glucanosyltransferase n=1 Tax=Lagenidium giganteum TaxID=4803 RepID=A0AAV2Z4G9_9STRA|nr:TPA: LOW QUALITY PROTEIN: hypothetical protein N0F65_011538 [Lagenidium giganteum]